LVRKKSAKFDEQSAQKKYQEILKGLESSDLQVKLQGEIKMHAANFYFFLVKKKSC
jgi:hypothetical protein